MNKLLVFFASSSLLITAALPFAIPDGVDQAWKNYQINFRGSIYLDGSVRRKELFTQTHLMIEEHNSGNHAFTLDHNIFSIMTEEEKQRYLGAVLPSNFSDDSAITPSWLKSQDAPDSLDYRGNPCVGPIKDQGYCGSCYAFSALSSLEFSQCQLNKNSYTSLSEQQVVDCDMYDKGCSGGWMDNVFNYIKENKGVDTTSSYPYNSGSTGDRNGNCNFKANSVGGKVERHGKLTPYDHVGMKDALVEYGVLAVTIGVFGNFQQYQGGVYNDESCDGKGLNHAVNIVGYGRDPASGLDYWILRNSWGSGWGQAGYMLIQRGVNKCDVEHNIYYVTAERL